MPLEHAVSKLGKTYHVEVRRARPVLREMGIVLLCFPSLQVKEIHSFSDQMVRNCMHNLACLLLGTDSSHEALRMAVMAWVIIITVSLVSTGPLQC